MNIDLDPEEIPDEVSATVSWMPDSIEPDQLKLGRALFRLQLWLMEMRKRQASAEEEEGEDGIIRLDAEVSSRFALGLLPGHAFIVMPELEARWAGEVPWSHATMRESNPTLFLVIDNLRIDEVEGANFGISFEITDFAKASVLSSRAELELRRYEMTENGWRVAPEPMARMPIQIMGEGESVFTKSKRKLKPKSRGR